MKKGIGMGTIVLKGKSKENLNLIILLAQKLGVEVSVLSEQAAEDIALAAAIKKGRTGEIINTNDFLKELNDES
ncbi:MAG TPA: hypothetical protein VJ949_03040 [Cryomorphaceae bacterium]|nr:hypothetical protein [Cryomorphaceae bacterium]